MSISPPCPSCGDDLCVSRVARRAAATRKAIAASGEPTTLFSWGYWGWGTSTSELIQAVDAVENARGFKPPYFVDIRYRRSGHAPEFVGNAFKNKLGEGRYKWMYCLGNKGIETGITEIVDEAAADKLLDLAVECACANRRLLFFCACMFPCWARFPGADGHFCCHRSHVGGLVMNSAKRRRIPVKVVEWPGQGDQWDARRLGKPITSLTVSAEVLAAVSRGCKTIPVPKALPLERAGALPWGSIVALQSGGESLSVITGPAKYKKSWRLYILERAESGTPQAELDAMAEKWRRDLGVDNRTEREERPDESSSDPDCSKADDDEEVEYDPKEVAEYIADQYDYHAKLGERFPDSDLREIHGYLDKLNHGDLKKVAKCLHVDGSGGAQDIRDRLLEMLGDAHKSADPAHVQYRENVKAWSENAKKLAHKGGDASDFLKNMKTIGGARFTELVAVKLGAHGKTEGKESASKSVKAIKALMEKQRLRKQ